VLLEGAALDPLGVRVPLFPGDLAQTDAGAGAVVGRIGGGEGGRRARMVRGPASADPASSSVDLYFELPNGDGQLRPGERVAVTIALRGRGPEGLVVPWSSVVRDIGGGAWVYERLGEGRYARRRVEVAHVEGDEAVLARGLSPGAVVVAIGAAELFSTEFGPSK
jgi:multidrug efflux system membrane fusion protein